MRKLFILLAILCLTIPGFSQTFNTDSAMKVLSFQKDSTLRAMFQADSVKVEKEFAEAAKWTKLKGVATYPFLHGGDQSGVLPISNLTEIADPNIEYKLLFDFTMLNPDSASKEINFSLTEIARIINLHVAAGIPPKKIIPVIVVHAGALKSITTNQFYKELYKTDNPNLKLIDEIKNMGGSFIACGQAMSFLDIKRESLLPMVKVALTAKTVLSSYQLKGFVLMTI